MAYLLAVPSNVGPPVSMAVARGRSNGDEVAAPGAPIRLPVRPRSAAIYNGISVLPLRSAATNKSRSSGASAVMPVKLPFASSVTVPAPSLRVARAAGAGATGDGVRSGKGFDTFPPFQINIPASPAAAAPTAATTYHLRLRLRIGTTVSFGIWTI